MADVWQYSVQSYPLHFVLFAIDATEIMSAVSLLFAHGTGLNQWRIHDVCLSEMTDFLIALSEMVWNVVFPILEHSIYCCAALLHYGHTTSLETWISLVIETDLRRVRIWNSDHVEKLCIAFLALYGHFDWCTQYTDSVRMSALVI